MSVYKDLREKNQQQTETQAYGLTELENTYQIVVDVNGYGASDIAVKAVGDKELVVEGKRLQTTPDGKTTTSSFSRRFELPGLVRLDAITSALSKDGVLTVSAPKLNVTPPKQTQSIKANNLDNQSANGNTFHGNFFDERQKLCDHQLSNMLIDLDMDSKTKFQTGFKQTDAPKTLVPEVQHRSSNGSPDMIEETDHYKISLDITGYSPSDISVKAVGDRELLVEGKHVEKTQTGSESVKSFNRRFCLPGLVKLEAITSSLSLDGKLTIRAPKKQEAIQQQNISNQSHMHGVPVNNSAQQNFITKVYKTENSAPQPPQQDAFSDFFSDDFGMDSMMPRRNPSSFMDKARNEYEDSMKNMRNKHWTTEPAQPEGFFSDFPVMQKGVQNEPSNIIESENDYKVKLDVSKYQPKDISVKAVGERELLIEGKQIVKQAGGPEINQSFSRKFSLPGVIKLDAVKSSLSPDGFLTITAPKAH